MLVCPYTYKGFYSALISGNHFIIPDLQAAFRTKMLTQKKCTELTPPLYEGHGVLIKPVQNSKVRRMKRSLDPTNLKLNFLEYKIKQSEKERFLQVYQELCKNTQRFLDLISQLLVIDPTLSERAFLQRHNVSAEYYGDVVLVWNCNTVNISKFHFNYSVNSVCYKFLPIITNGKLRLVPPGSNEILNSSPIINCSEPREYIFKNDSGWFNTKGNVDVLQIPYDIIWNNPSETLPFDTAPVIKTNQHLSLLESIQSIKQTVLKTHKLEAAISALVKSENHRMFQPKFIYNKLKRTNNKYNF